MALNKQTIAIGFSKGLDTKTDNKQVVPGKLLSLENATLKKVGKFTKRYGYGVIANNAGVANGNALATFKNELLAFDGSTINSYSVADDSLYSKGTKIAVDLSVQSVARNSYEQTNPDSAIHSSGFSFFAWDDSSGAVRYSIFDTVTQQAIYANQLLQTGSSLPKIKINGNYVLIFYLYSGDLYYSSVDVTSLGLFGAGVLVASGVSVYDVGYNSNKVYVSYAIGSNTYIAYLDSALVLSTATVIAQTSSCLGLFFDSSNNVWLTYNSGNSVKFVVYDSTLSTQVSAPAVTETGSAPYVNVTGYYDTTLGEAILFYEVTGDEVYNQSVRYANAQIGGGGGTYGDFMRSVGLFSKAFKYGSGYYVILTHESALQPTYFVVDSNKVIVGKVAPSLGGGLAATSHLVEVNNYDTNKFLFAYEYKDFVQSVGGDVTTQTGINSGTLSFGQALLSQEIGNNLHVSGGVISAYDGQNINELGFHLYPENLDYEITLSGGGLKQGNYQYVAVYEWTDNQGQIHRSAPSIPLDVDTTLGVRYYDFTISGIAINDQVGGPYYESSYTNIGMKITGPGITGTAYISDAVGRMIGGSPYTSGTSGTYKLEPGSGFNASSTIGSNIVNLTRLVANAESYKVSANIVSGSSTLELNDDYQIPSYSLLIYVDPITGTTQTVGVLSQSGRIVTLGTFSFNVTTVLSSFGYTANGVYLIVYGGIAYKNGSFHNTGTAVLQNLPNTAAVVVGREYLVSNPTRTATVLSKTSTTVTLSSNFTSTVTYAVNNWFSFYLPYPKIPEGSVFTEYNSTGTAAFGTFTVIKDNGDGTIEVDSVATQSRTGSTFVSPSACGCLLTIPTLRITDKTDGRISVYRSLVNGTVFYKIDSVDSPIVNDKTIDILEFSDDLTDEEIVGNEQLYTTGGEVENISPPASNIISTYKNRLVAVPNEDTLSFWYSKQVRSNTPIEFNDSFIQRAPEKGGAITALQQMDDKLLIFKQDHIFVMVGDGPSVSGVNNDFTDPQLITADCGCSDKKSVVTLPTGVIYKSQKGYYLIDRALNVKYIGADVENYNSYSVTSARMIETENQVRFTLSNGECLVYDYYVEQWAVFKSINAADSVNFQDKYTYIVPSGQIRKENTSYTDNGSFVPMVIETGWLNLAGIMGYQRVYHVMLVGTYKSPHTLQVQFYRDFVDAPYDTITIPVLSAPTKYQYRIFPSIQKCESIKIKITELQSSPYGEGFDISAINIEVGVKRGQNKLSPDESYG